MPSELYKRFRPKKLESVVGQEDAVKKLRTFLDKGTVPQAILFTGPSGCGKTTLARIVGAALGCDPKHYVEKNAADDRGIDAVRAMQVEANKGVLFGKVRVFVLDEAHKLTNDAQNALLKILEDTPKTTYVFLCTTDPGKLIDAVQTRCTTIKVKPVADDVLANLVRKVYTFATKAKDPLDEDTVQAIVAAAGGSARRALVRLGEVIDLPADERADAVQAADTKEEAFKLVKVLLPFDHRNKPTWKAVADVLTAIKGEDPEGVRRLILAVCTTHLLKAGPMTARAAVVMNCFRDPFFDQGSAFQMLALCSYEAVASLNN